MKLELIVWQDLLAYWKNKPSLCGLAWRDTLVFAQGMNKIWFFIKTVARRPAKQRHKQGGTKVKPVGSRNPHEQYGTLPTKTIMH